MDDLDTVTRFFGWCTVLNFGFLALSAACVVLFRGWAVKIHSRLFGLSEESLSQAYFQFLAQYEIAVFFFNLVPYLALKLGR